MLTLGRTLNTHWTAEKLSGFYTSAFLHEEFGVKLSKVRKNVSGCGIFFRRVINNLSLFGGGKNVKNVGIIFRVSENSRLDVTIELNAVK